MERPLVEAAPDAGPVAAVPEEAAPAENWPAPASSWRVVGAVVRGVAHERLGLPCQDAQDYRLLPDGTLLVAVADGAGSASFSDQGARMAVNEILHALADRISETGQAVQDWENLVRAGFGAAREAVLRLAEEVAQETAAAVAPAADAAVPASAEQALGNDPLAGTAEAETALAEDADEDEGETESAPAAAEEHSFTAHPAVRSTGVTVRNFATTLTCAIATAGRLVVGQVGDGAVVAGDGADLFAVTRLQRGEYANETHFITQADALEHLDIQVIERPVSALAVMSDGLIRLALKMPAQEPHAPFFQPLFRSVAAVGDEASAAQQLSAFLGSARVNARTDDDKSLVLAVRSDLRRSDDLRESAGSGEPADSRESSDSIESADSARPVERTMDEESTPGEAA